jgi:hypothetical protein
MKQKKHRKVFECFNVRTIDQDKLLDSEMMEALLAKSRVDDSDELCASSSVEFLNANAQLDGTSANDELIIYKQTLIAVAILFFCFIQFF